MPPFFSFTTFAQFRSSSSTAQWFFCWKNSILIFLTRTSAFMQLPSPIHAIYTPSYKLLKLSTRIRFPQLSFLQVFWYNLMEKWDTNRNTRSTQDDWKFCWRPSSPFLKTMVNEIDFSTQLTEGSDHRHQKHLIVVEGHPYGDRLLKQVALLNHTWKVKKWNSLHNSSLFCN